MPDPIVAEAKSLADEAKVLIDASKRPDLIFGGFVCYMAQEHPHGVLDALAFMQQQAVKEGWQRNG